MPLPRIHMVRYHGVLAPNHAWRRLVVAKPRVTTPGEKPHVGSRWIVVQQAHHEATLLRRVFLVEALVCSSCGGERRPVQVVKEGPVAWNILDHLGLPTTVPGPTPWRPERELWDATGPPDDWDQRSPETDWDQRTDSESRRLTSLHSSSGAAFLATWEGFVPQPVAPATQHLDAPRWDALRGRRRRLNFLCARGER